MRTLGLFHGGVDPFDFVELRVLVLLLHLLVVRRLLRSVKNQGPFEKRACIHGVIFARGHRYLQLPQPTWVFSPGMSRHERPPSEAILVVIVVRALAENHCSETECRQMRHIYWIIHESFSAAGYLSFSKKYFSIGLTLTFYRASFRWTLFSRIIFWAQDGGVLHPVIPPSSSFFLKAKKPHPLWRLCAVQGLHKNLVN